MELGGTSHPRLKLLTLQSVLERAGRLPVLQSALHMSINQGELDKIQADLRARQTQEAANLAAQMAQVRGSLQYLCWHLQLTHWELQWVANRSR